MFWKRGKGRRWSITRRFAIHYAVSIFFLLAVSTGILYWGLTENLKNYNREYLRNEIVILKAMLKNSDYESVLMRVLIVEQGALENVKRYIRILRPDGEILLETPSDMARLLPVSLFPPPALDKPYGEKGKWKSPNGSLYILRTVSISEQGENRILQIALDATSTEKVIRDYRHKLVLVLIFGVLIFSAAGVVIARLCLRPIREITKTTTRISATHLKERINTEALPDELTALADSFHMMLDRLEDSFSRLSSCAVNLAHELRTPINNLMGEAEIALSKARNPEEYRSVIESSLEEYERLSLLIGSLLFLARADTRETVIDKKQTNVCRELMKMKDFYGALAERARLEVDCAGDLVVLADPSLFRRAVCNLISNSLKYIGEDGMITIRSAPSADGSVEVTVEDNGCGIAKEELPRLFDKFYRVETTRHLHPHGSGLGLSIVKSIMDLHGGSVSIHSIPGQGTSVALRFPPALLP